ncbi:hypothetical protein MGYG_06923 [Nannizzia gypsea CBS 118893]|uniref:Uncharacterized protein n=1 Tax=Arthroderma gypseum (strain ATCC MYA-4604 / CBS 118893) TaxID=535722 RepID=E4V1K9_ARTGP|nr:hypothetical protein MGYG_06923 [Nannizzia gypsea CBS 118893]EFR03924.1 hypothetical protein MGYG_06923 [Nannizzia gypsea CBS 118893]
MGLDELTERQLGIVGNQPVKSSGRNTTILSPVGWFGWLDGLSPTLPVSRYGVRARTNPIQPQECASVCFSFLDRGSLRRQKADEKAQSGTELWFVVIDAQQVPASSTRALKNKDEAVSSGRSQVEIRRNW